MKEKMSPTDKELFVRVIKNDMEAYEIFTRRYKPRINSIFNKKFSGMKNKLSYDLNQLNEDVESAVWGKLFTKSIDDLEFDDQDSIGGLLHSIAERHILSMYEKTENHRSKHSRDERKKLRSEDIKITTDHGFSSLEEYDLNDSGLINPARLILTEEIVNNKYNELSTLQKKILHYKNNGSTQNEIALTIGLTVDQVRTQIIKIKKISDNAREQLRTYT